MFGIYRSEAAMAPLKQTWDQADPTFRDAILQASHRLDLQLHEAPHNQGESRSGRTRILFDAPLAVVFEVDETKKLVRILRAWAYASRPGGQNSEE